MWQQKSFQNTNNGGILYLVPTPIGNLEDMTFRGIRILKEVHIIAAEDTRQTKKLCNHFEIETPVMSYHEHNKQISGDKIITLLKEGKDVAIVSDAGMPTISDPGYELVVQALEERYHVVPLPGANAALTALIASGLPTDHFYYFGFLNRQKKDKRKQLESLKNRQETLIFYESPHRLKETLQIMVEILGNRKITLSRELTKKFEEFIRGSIEEAIEWATDENVRGEFCLLVEGAKESEIEEETNWWDTLTINEHVDYYVSEKSLSSKEAIKQVAVDRGLPKRDVYQQYHVD
jgi:16S rRNA (cytidine1402-2'-O)-methyltransferase